MTDNQQNFNREINKLLQNSEDRIQQLRKMIRPPHPWEKERIKDRLTKVENKESWRKEWIKSKINRLEKELKNIWAMFIFSLIILLTLCGIFGFLVFIKIQKIG